jgi:hypothetical protein
MSPSLYDHVDGEPFLVNPPLALWGATSNPRRRATTMKRRSRRHRRNPPAALAANPPAGRRRTRRATYAYNPPRRSKAKARRSGRRRAGGGGVNVNALLPSVGIGVGAGLLLSYVTPMVARTIGVPEAGTMFRLVQAGVAFGLPWAARSAGLISGATAQNMSAFGLTLTGLSLVRDFQAGGGGLAGFYRLAPGANRQALQGAPAGVSGYPSPAAAMGAYYKIG